jgi:hypothetical protein
VTCRTTQSLNQGLALLAMWHRRTTTADSLYMRAMVTRRTLRSTGIQVFLASSLWVLAI